MAEAEVTEQQAAAGTAQPPVGAAQPAAPLTMLDILHWLMDDIRSLREEGNRHHEALLAEIKALRQDGNKHHEESKRRHEALLAEIKALRQDGNKHHEESKRRHEQFLEGFHSLEKPVARMEKPVAGMEKPVARQFHNSQKQIWILPTIAVALILATGDPENPIVNLLFSLFGIV